MDHIHAGADNADIAPGRHHQRLINRKVADLAGGTAVESAAMLEALLDGEKGPRRDIVLLNAGASLLIAGKAPDLSTGIRLAAAAIDEGRAAATLAALRAQCGKVRT